MNMSPPHGFYDWIRIWGEFITLRTQSMILPVPQRLEKSPFRKMKKKRAQTKKSKTEEAELKAACEEKDRLAGEKEVLYQKNRLIRIAKNQKDEPRIDGLMSTPPNPRWLHDWIKHIERTTHSGLGRFEFELYGDILDWGYESDADEFVI
eukprot:Seg914.1 transcript_id=Seg914.1/GoldUCD/mRNA.D3Y31 product="hypothetical protein" protein_id=Seg914.1/GoldUCD/D3Y31